MYHAGEGVDQDYKGAARWIRKAADQGHSDAQFNLGIMYLEGEGVDQDFKEAMRWIRKSADKGDADAQMKVAEMYRYGLGVAQGHSEVGLKISRRRCGGLERQQSREMAMHKAYSNA